MNGSSIGHIPSHPSIIKLPTKNQKKNWENELNLLVVTLKSINGRYAKIAIANPITNTPPSLSGIDLKIA